jgi:DNA-binding transcriptional regulator YbjK
MDDDARERVRELHEHLAATAERPVEARASQWLGEAEAAARDAAGDGVPEVAVAKRVSQVVHLLDNVEETGDDVADGHVAAARELAAELDAALDEFDGE